MREPYAKLVASMWEEGSDFRNLPSQLQRAYFVLISQPNISHCGVLPCAFRRWGNLAPDTTPASFEADVASLVEGRYLFIDTNTDELWVRSWMKYDGLMAINNGPKGIARSIEAVLSATLRAMCRSAAFDLAPDRHRALFQPRENPVRTASERRPNYSSSSSHTNSDCEPPQQQHDAAAATFDHMVELRRQATGKISNPIAWAASTRAGLIHDHAKYVVAMLEEGNTPEQVAYMALGLKPPLTVVPAHDPEPESYANPECQACDGSGIENVAEEGQQATYVDCSCVRSEPYPVASVVALGGRRKGAAS